MKKALKQIIEDTLRQKIISSTEPPQGMESFVLFITLEDQSEYAIKFGKGSIGDKIALKLLSDNTITIPVPRVITEFEYEGKPAIVLEKIQSPMLESVPTEEIPRYIPSMLANMRKIHTIKSTKAGYIFAPESSRTWKEFLLHNFVDENGDIDRKDIEKREYVDSSLLRNSIEELVAAIESTEMPKSDYSLLHTDFNQRNLFVNPKNHEVAGIIDWGESMFGDPIFDFARIRMYLWHFNLGEEVVREYYDLVQFNEKEIKLEQIYWLYRVVEYIAWYSEELNAFNIGRIKLHQEFLQSYTWKGFNC